MVAQHRSALPGVEAMTLLTGHAFPRHSHDGFGIGVMTAGAQRSWSGIGPVESTAGDVITVNPGEMHDGTPIHGARGWRMLYLDPALVAQEVAEAVGDAPEIARPALRDPVLRALFERLFARATADVPEPLALEEDLLRTLMHVLRRHRARPRPVRPTSPAVAAARCRLDEAPERPVTLAELTALSGVDRFAASRLRARDWRDAARLPGPAPGAAGTASAGCRPCPGRGRVAGRLCGPEPPDPCLPPAVRHHPCALSGRRRLKAQGCNLVQDAPAHPWKKPLRSQGRTAHGRLRAWLRRTGNAPARGSGKDA